jgi:hypothetical protein
VPNPPKLDPARGPRGRGIIQLPSGGREGETPDWPLPEPASAEETAAWEDLWRLPQAAMWEKQRIVRTVARYCRMLVQAEQLDAKASLHAQVTAMEDRLGLTPKAMRLLLWEITTDEVAAKRAEHAAADARDRLKVVG